MTQSASLKAIKTLHTIVWALFASCIVAIPVAAWQGHHRVAAWLTALVLLEVVVLAFNQWACPLTAVAARFTTDRRANFDIYLPEWLAKNNKSLFGTLYIVGVLFTIVHWYCGTPR